MKHRARFVVAATALMVAGATASACGPRSQDSAGPLRGVPGDLVAATTTSTTTSTLAPAVPRTTLPTEPVVMHYIVGESVAPVLRNIPINPDPQDVLDALFEGFEPGPFGGEVRSALPRDLTATVEVERGLATVNTDGGLLSDISPLDQPLAIAQIVLTLTSRPGIGQVAFLVNGQPQSVPRGGGELAAPDAPVAYDDYAMLLAPARMAAGR